MLLKLVDYRTSYSFYLIRPIFKEENPTWEIVYGHLHTQNTAEVTKLNVILNDKNITISS